MQVTGQGLERRSVRLQPVGPGIAVEFGFDFLDVAHQPGQHVLQAGDIGETIERNAF